MPIYQARPFTVGIIEANGLQYYDLAIGEQNVDYGAYPEGLQWFMGPDEIPGFVIAKSNGAEPTFWRSTDKTDASYLALLQHLYQNMTGLLPGNTIPWFDSFLLTNQMYTTYERSGSLSINGPNCCVTVDNTISLIPGFSDFTVEWFQKQEAGSISPSLFQFGPSPADFGISFEAGSLFFWYNGQSISRVLPSWLNEWIHLAVSRRNGYIRIFYNGVQLGQPEYIPDTISSEEPVMHIGIDSSNPNNTYFTGLISNLHFTIPYSKYFDDSFPIPTSGINISYHSTLLLRASNNSEVLKDSSPVSHIITDLGSNPITWSSEKPFV